MFHFIKSLEKEVYTAAILVLVIIGLTTEGFGGAGRSAMTAMAETPAALPEEEDKDLFGKKESSDLQEMEGDAFDRAQGDSSQSNHGEVSDRADGEDLKEIEDTGNIEYGQQVVGYLLTKERKEQEEAEERRVSAAKETEKAQENETSLSQQDYQVLLKIVEAEAGVCDDKGKILVANVILNRVESDEFPDSVTDVVYQPSQFSPVSNGSINTCQVSSETVESVNRALKGEDYSQGALFFMNRAASRSGSVRWFDGRLTYLFGYQGHEFFK